MKIQNTICRQVILTDLNALDPITVFLEDLSLFTGKGRITITCFGKAWTAYWGAMGDDTSVAEFFCGCDEHYIAKNLSRIDSNVYDLDTLQEQAAEKGIDCYRDDPWNDYEFMDAMYGGDMYEWSDALPKKPNPEYRYLCRIIKAVQEGLKDG